MTDLTPRLQERFGERVKLDEPMSKHTNFRIGGPARWFLEVKTEDELRDAVAIADEAQVRIIIHGGGSNVLYADTPIDALVLVPAFRELTIEGSRMTTGAGVLSAMLARKTAEAGLAGLTWMISLPGTIGGAVRGNAGCFGGEVKDRLVSARVLKVGGWKSDVGGWKSDVGGWKSDVGDWKSEVEEVPKDKLEMRYRHSVLKEEKGKDWIVLSATFELEAGDRDALKTELEETIAKRKASQPTNAGCAGCVFKNYEIESDEELVRLKEKLDIPEAMVKKRRLGAGWIVEQLGLKGFAIGGAKVSEVHGNFLVSEGATADEIMQLIAVIKTRARNTLGIQLQEEIQYVK